MDRRPGAPMTIDCSTCPVQHVGCPDCMVTALLAPQEFDPLRGSAVDGLAPQRPEGGLAPQRPEGGLAPQRPEGEGLPLDRREREVVSRLVVSGLVTPETATRARAVREPWSEYRELTREVG